MYRVQINNLINPIVQLTIPKGSKIDEKKYDRQI